MQTETETPRHLGSSAWLGGVPDVPKGKRQDVLVAVKSASGKLRVTLAAYANAHWIEWHPDYDGEDIDENGGKHWTGWLEDKPDMWGDGVTTEFEGEVVAWMPLPEPPNSDWATRCRITNGNPPKNMVKAAV